MNAPTPLKMDFSELDQLNQRYLVLRTIDTGAAIDLCQNYGFITRNFQYLLGGNVFENIIHSGFTTAT